MTGRDVGESPTSLILKGSEMRIVKRFCRNCRGTGLVWAEHQETLYGGSGKKKKVECDICFGEGEVAYKQFDKKSKESSECRERA